MTKPALIAQITGEAYRHTLEWRYEVDSKIIQEQIDSNGKALVIAYDPQPGFAQVTELPAAGTARPHCGAFDGGYE